METTKTNSLQKGLEDWGSAVACAVSGQIQTFERIAVAIIGLFLDTLHFTSHPAFSTSKKVISRIARFSLEKGIQVLFDLTKIQSDFLIFD